MQNHIETGDSGMRWIAYFILIASLCTPTSLQGAEVRLEVHPDSISIGESAELTWKVQEGCNVYISNVGSAGISGRMKVSPDYTTSYTLIAEGASGLQTRTAILRVEGSRGDLAFPGMEHFRFPRTYRTLARSLVDFFDRIHKVLQDSMDFSLNEYEDRNTGRFVFITNRSQRGYLVQKGEKGIRARRISYLVEVTKPNSALREFSYTIKAVIEYQRMVEKTWREESSEPIYIEEINRLKEEIAKSSNF